MDDSAWLAERFEQQRPRLRAVAYRMLGSLAEADDAVQDAWLRLAGAEADEIDNLAGWLTTVVARECLRALRARRREERLPDPVVTLDDGDLDPEQEALLADSVGLALLVVLDSLTPAERLAFVLHDMFELPFDEIAPMVGRTPTAARQLASRARRRVQGAEAATSDPDQDRQRQVVEAFYAAARAGDFEALVRLLDPDVVARVDFGPGRPLAVIRGARAVGKLARAPQAARLHPVLVNGAPGALITLHGEPVTILTFTVVNGRIAETYGIADPDRVRRLAAAVLSP